MIKQNVRPLCSYLVLKWKVNQNNKVNKRNCRMKDHSHDQTEWDLLYFRCDSRLKLYCLRSDLLNGKKSLWSHFAWTKMHTKSIFLRDRLERQSQFPPYSCSKPPRFSKDQIVTVIVLSDWENNRVSGLASIQRVLIRLEQTQPEASRYTYSYKQVLY